MLKINLSPTRSDRIPLTASYSAQIITIDGTDYDLSLIPDGATVDHDVIKSCTRTGNDYDLTLTLPHGANAPQETRFPQPITVTADGPIDLPAYDVDPTTGEVAL